MASLSSLFNIGGAPKSVAPAATIQTSELPKQIAPYYEKLLKEAEALYKQKMEAGAPIYEGKTMAGFTPEQEQLFTGLQGLQGTQAPKFAEAEALTRGTAARVTPDEVQEYMNPYQQAVVDIEKREAEKQYQSTVVPQLAAQAAAAGSFGGSRQGILEGMASEANQRLQADIQAKGSAQAYQDAMSNINQQRQREGAAAGQLAQLAPAGFSAQAQELGAIGKVGDAKQQQQQLALDEAYKQYIQEQQFPSESLKEYQSYVQSFPNMPTQITRVPEPQQPGIAQSLLGLGTTALGTYGAFGGFSPGGFMGMKQAETGGGISGLPIVYRQKSGKINKPGTMVSRFLDETSKKLGIPGYVEEEEETPLGTGLKALKEGTGMAIKNVTLPLDFLTGKDPRLFGYDLKSAPELLTTAGERLIETKGERKKRIAEDRFKDISPDDADELNKKLREANKGKPPSVDPIMETSPEAKKDMVERGLLKEQADNAKIQAELEARLKQTQKNTPEESAIKNQIAQLKEAYIKIGEYEAPDYSGVTSAMGDARKIKQDVISSLGKEKQEIRDEELSGFGQAAIKAGQAIMKAPNLITAITDGMAAAGFEGKKATDTARSKKKANKEKAQAITLEIANDKVAEQQFILSMKTDAEAKKAQRIIDKIKTGVQISTADANFMNAKTNRIDAETKRIKAETEASGVKKMKEVAPADLKFTEAVMKAKEKSIYEDEGNIARAAQLNMDKKDFKKTVERLKTEDDFILQMSDAWERAFASGQYDAAGKSDFIANNVVNFLELNPKYRKATFPSNIIKNPSKA
jgi:hypothetical protein